MSIIIKKKRFSISIFVKLIAGYFIPVSFMILLGIIALSKSSSGLNENYENSTNQAIDMTANYLELVLETAQGEVDQYSKNIKLYNYMAGESIGDLTKQLAFLDTVNKAMEAEVIVSAQNISIQETIEVFQDMRDSIQKAVTNMELVYGDVYSMDSTRVSTLEAIQNISAVSEETCAASSMVNDSLIAQEEVITHSEKVSIELKQNAEILKRALEQFSI